MIRHLSKRQTVSKEGQVKRYLVPVSVLLAEFAKPTRTLNDHHCLPD